MANYWSDCRYPQGGMPLFNAFVRGEPLNSGRRDLVPRNYINIEGCEVHFDTLNHLDVTHKCDRRTDRQTDRQTNILRANVALLYVARFSLTVYVHRRCVTFLIDELQRF